MISRHYRFEGEDSAQKMNVSHMRGIRRRLLRYAAASTVAALSATAALTVGAAPARAAAPTAPAGPAAPSSSPSQPKTPGAPDSAISHGPAPAKPTAKYTAPASGTSSAPSAEQAASAKAEETGTAVEVTSRTSETVKVMANPDGTFTLTSNAVPVRVKKNGAWTPIDATLTANSDGTFSPKASTMSVAFSGGGTGPAVVVTAPGGTQSLSLSWPTALPAPQVSGNAATYANVLPGVDLRLAASGDSYNEVLIVHDAAAASNPALKALSMKIHGKGLTVGTSSDHGLVASDGKGKQVLHATQPIMWDSRLAPHIGPAPTADDPGSGIVTPLPTTLTPQASASTATTDAGDDAQVTVAPPASALTGPHTSYPLYIDPGFSHTYQHWLLVSDQGSTTWDSTTLTAKTGYCDWAGCTSPAANMQSFFQMDTSELATAPNGSRATVTSANFFVNEVWSAHDCTTEPVDLYSAGAIASGQSWPGPILNMLDRQYSAAGGGTSCPAGSVELNALSWVQQAAANAWPNTTFAIRADNYNDAYQWKQFQVTASSPYSPVLSVVFSYPPTVAVNGIGSTGGVGGYYTCTGPLVLSNTSPTLWATPYTSFNQKATLNFEVYAQDTGALVASGSSGSGASNTSNHWTINPGGLSDRQYRWHVRAINDSGLASAWSPDQYFTIMAHGPGTTPSLTSGDYQPGYWGPAGGGSFTIGANGSGNIVGYAYALQRGTAAASVPPVPTNCSYSPGNPRPSTMPASGYVPDSGGSATVNIPTGLAQGPYTLTVFSFDAAHNPSATSSFTFFAAPNYGPGPTKFEGETTSAWSSTTNPTSFQAQANCCGVTWSGGGQEFLNGNKSEVSAGPGKGSVFSFAFTPSTTFEADYAVSAVMTKATDYGKLKFDIDGAYVLANTATAPWDGYSPTVTTAFVDLGGVHLTPGKHTLNITVMDTNTASTGVRFYAGMDFLRVIPVNHVGLSSFAAAMNNIGISANGSPSTGSLDDLSDNGGAHSFSQEQLTTAGFGPNAPVGIDGATFTMPNVAAGQPDNVVAMGQTIPFPAGQQVKTSAIGFLVAATCANDPVKGSPGQSTATIWANGFDANGNPGQALTGQVGYNDGNANTVYTMPPVPDWVAGPDATAAVKLTSWNGQGSGNSGPHLYALFVPTDPTRVLKSVTLPYIASGFSPYSCRAIHIFAMTTRPADTTWTGAWASPTENAWTLGTAWSNQTVRTQVHPTFSGSQVRVRLENTFGSAPVNFGHVTVATQSSGAASTTTPVGITFNGSASVTVPAGSDVYSDPIGFNVTAGTNLLVSYSVPGTVGAVSAHSMAASPVWTTAGGAGDHTADTASSAFGTSLSYTAFLAGVDVASPGTGSPGTIVALGDSYTSHSTGTGPLWPDLLAQATYTDPILGTPNSATGGMGIVNTAVYGNQAGSGNAGSLRTGDQPVTEAIPASLIGTGGPSAASRYDRDVLGVGGATAVIVAEGSADLSAGSGASSAATLATQVEQNLKNLASSLHGYTTADGSARVPVVVIATIPPFTPALPSTDIREQARALVNTDILNFSTNYAQCTASGNNTCDVVDFDAAVRDPANVHQIKAADLTSGAPNDAFQNDIVNAVTAKEAGGTVIFAPQTPQAPTAALTVSPSTGTAPVTVTADASGTTQGSAPIASYAFDFGDGYTSGAITTASAGHSYTKAGTFTVTMTVTDASGLTAQATRQVTVTDPAPTVPGPAQDDWKLGEGTGTVAADSGTPGGYPATVTGNTQLAPGGYALFDRTTGENLATTGPVVDTSKSFTVSAWARLSYTANSYTVAAQNGNTSYGFWLGYDHALNSWALETVQGDATATTTYIAAGLSGSAAAGQWTHLVGTFDTGTGKLTLYVNGVPQSRQDTWPTPFTAPGTFMIGDSVLNGAASNAMHGGIADVRVYSSALSATEASWLYQNTGFTPPNSLVYALSAPTALTSSDGTVSACSTDPAHPAVSTSATPHLGASLTSSSQHADFEMWDVTNPQSVPPLYYNGTGSGSGSGTTVSITTPTLTNGHEYGFSARAHQTGTVLSATAPYCYVQISVSGQAAAPATGAVGMMFDNSVYPASTGPITWSGPVDNLVWTNTGHLQVVKKSGQVIWDDGVAASSSAVLAVQSDGGLVIYSSMPLNSTGGTLTGGSIWTANIGGKGGTSLALQTDGNFAAYAGTTLLWSTGTNTETFANVSTGNCLDSDSTGAVSTTTCSGSATQNWTITDNGDGTWSLTDASTGLCLDSTSTTLSTDACGGGTSQRWTHSWGASGWILTDQATGMVLDSESDGTPYPNTGNTTTSQQWT